MPCDLTLKGQRALERKVPQAYDLSGIRGTPRRGVRIPLDLENKQDLHRGAVVTIEKIVGLIGIAVAILSAFVAIPYVFGILVIAGLIVGFWVSSADHVRLILTAVALLAFAGNFGHVAYAGKHIATILTSGSYMAMGAALMVILRNLYEHFQQPSKATAS